MKIYANNTDIAALGGSSIGIILVGGYAGYSNFGDILQLISTIDFYKSQIPDALIGIAIDAETHGNWRDKLPPRFRDSVFPIFIIDEEYNHATAIMPEDWSGQFVFPPALILHYYGGGYITDEWGPRKRRAGESILALCAQAGSRTCVYFSGIQVADASEAQRWSALLACAEVVGARDAISMDMCKQILGIRGGDKLILQGDDALPAIIRMRQRVSRPLKPRVGVHVSAADYTTGDPQARFEMLADALEAASSILGSGGELVNLVAYQDQHIDEATYIHEFRGSIAKRNTEPLSDWSVAELSLLECLQSENIAMPFDLVISCSYHVAYTALTFGVPVIFITDVPYYEQKAAGLLEHFGSEQLAILAHKSNTYEVVSALLQNVHRTSSNLAIGKQWLGLTQVRDAISQSVQRLLGVHKEEERESIVSEFRNNSLALAELKRRVILMERYEANLEAEIASLKERPFLIAPKQEVRKLKREWRRIRERLGLRKPRIASL